MNVLLVTYDLNKPGQDYSELLKKIKSYPYARLSESSYAIETFETPINVYQKLNGYIDTNDRLAVITLKRPYYGWLSQEVINWLDTRLDL